MEQKSTPVRGVTEVQPEGGRSARKRRAIIEEATALFLRNGYQGTSMDEVAARAAVSKQTVYKNFADKEQLFTEIIRGVADRSEDVLDELGVVLRAADAKTGDDLERVLTELAVRYLSAVLQPQVLRLRRLVIAEADRFPELARYYYEKAPVRAVQILAAELQAYAERGLLQVADPPLAANTFAYLVLAIPQDRALFHPGEEPRAEEYERIAKEAVRVFLAAHR
ncbi:TetR/AcrR family transcriptional regulator [Amycolatopsis taiwanensis]|uniref:TetR family transcriptional regulator n=1 Tax=Amycolatopsis taiwanensis TaxID=342230 RepID=A0A9W6QWY8_9PSEU|nr:TetR/AcrR family transcriptional regulator [Amycolatopsis taiwanensis]GLY65084.1 TetR family transcriptional regulator [Amycolatopsis taiwanensis]